MAASFHFLFELVKIALLATGYSAVLFLLHYAVAEIPKLKFKKVRFYAIYRVVALVLFVFMFTYYGDHGLGDDSRIPIGHGESIRASDGYPYFVPANDFRQINISSYKIESDFLCAVTGDSIIAYNLQNKHLDTFMSPASYGVFAAKNNLPLAGEFEEFDKHYREYWSGWRFRVLP